jgi:hypothetical protein
MDTRDTVGVHTVAPGVVVSTPIERPDQTMVTEPSPRPQLPLVLATVVLVAAVGLGALVAGVLAGDDGTAVAQPQAQQPADLPAPPDPLTVTVAGPASASVGEPVDFTVTYADGTGIFAGTAEEWGDDVGTSSVQEGECPAAGEAAGPVGDTYRLAHTWTEPGTYTVVLGVHSYTCQGTTAVRETATRTLSLEVAAR